MLTISYGIKPGTLEPKGGRRDWSTGKCPKGARKCSAQEGEIDHDKKVSARIGAVFAPEVWLVAKEQGVHPAEVMKAIHLQRKLRKLVKE